MQKVGFFKSIYVKIVMIYILLIIIAIQIIGIYFVQKLEQTLKENFQESITDRVSLVEFSVREELLKVRDEDDQTIEQSLRSILYGVNSTDIKEVRVINNRFEIIATSDINNQSIVGQRSVDEIVRKSITTETPLNNISLDSETRKDIEFGF